MKYLPLLWANLTPQTCAHDADLCLGRGAFLLFGLLEAVNYALTGGAELAGQDRLVTQHHVSIIQSLPGNYLDRGFARSTACAAATSEDWFGGVLSRRPEPDHRVRGRATNRSSRCTPSSRLPRRS